MLIEIRPTKYAHQITFRCGEDGYQTEFSISDCIEVGVAVRLALEDFYNKVAQERINRMLGGA